ncbi:hypothetical protein IWW38_003568 [Coemansia aciculifera]|uniref:Uncharacterized protein n=1 Tax=Coemansia aciculifera TaxID=417176 RepID=A0ACC1M0S1_9FUNG|nr:hypothetical protein IWW38_003568 [Coemansia aciculifera]
MAETGEGPPNGQAAATSATAQNTRHYARPTRLITRLNAGRARPHLPTPPEDWQFVPSANLIPADSSPPRSRRRIAGDVRRRAAISSSLTALLASQPRLSELIPSQASAAWLDQLDDVGNGGEGQPARTAQEFEPPVIRGPIVDFDDISYGDVDDVIESDGSDTDMHRWEEGGFSSYEEWYAYTFLDGDILQLLDQDNGDRGPRIEPSSDAADSPSASGLRGSMMVRQPWNNDIAWSPYIYQQPAPNSALGDVGETCWRIKQHTLTASFREQSHLYSVHSSIKELPLRFLSTNDDLDSSNSHPRNMLCNNVAGYRTTRTSDVAVELCFESGRHCVVERIFVQSVMPRPRCTQLMVFASSRRYGLDELSKYDGFTFADYEQLARSVKDLSGRLPDPLPVAFFWLTHEDKYRQIQVLPRGVNCKYLYVKLLCSDRTNQKMGIRNFRVYGWSGPRSFSESAMI